MRILEREGFLQKLQKCRGHNSFYQIEKAKTIVEYNPLASIVFSFYDQRVDDHVELWHHSSWDISFQEHARPGNGMDSSLSRVIILLSVNQELGSAGWRQIKAKLVQTSECILNYQEIALWSSTDKAEILFNFAGKVKGLIGFNKSTKSNWS